MKIVICQYKCTSIFFVESTQYRMILLFNQTSRNRSGVFLSNCRTFCLCRPRCRRSFPICILERQENEENAKERRRRRKKLRMVLYNAIYAVYTYIRRTSTYNILQNDIMRKIFFWINQWVAWFPHSFCMMSVYVFFFLVL